MEYRENRGEKYEGGPDLPEGTSLARIYGPADCRMHPVILERCGDAGSAADLFHAGGFAAQCKTPSGSEGVCVSYHASRSE